MQRPVAVNEVSLVLTMNAIVFTWGGIVGIFLGLTTSVSYAWIFSMFGFFFLPYGVFIGIVTIQFRKLRPWTYSIVRFILLTLRGGAADLRKKLDDPEVLRAFGFKSGSEAQSDSQDKSGR